MNLAHCRGQAAIRFRSPLCRWGAALLVSAFLCSGMRAQYTIATDEPTTTQAIKEQASQAKPVRVTLDDIREGKVVILGQFGEPIGDLVRIRGTWEQVPDFVKNPLRLRFRVFSVNGRKLMSPVIIFSFDIQRLPDILPGVEKPSGTFTNGSTWELYGVEEGFYRSLPGSVYHLKSVPAPVPSPLPGLLNGFVTRFLYATATKIPDDER